MLPSVAIGECRNPQSHSMGCHVQTVGQQRHGTEDQTGGDLDNHGDCGDGHDDESSSLVPGQVLLAEDVVMVFPPAVPSFIVFHLEKNTYL